MQAVTNGKAYDWATWLMGILRSLVGGGSSAIVGAFGTMVIDPDHFNVTSGLRHTLSLMGVMFVLMGIVHMCMFLQTHGAPDQLTQSLVTAAAANVKAGEAIADAQSQAPKSDGGPSANSAA